MSTLALLLIAAAGVLVLLLLVIVLKLQAFVALLVVSFGVALVAGIPLGEIVPTITGGMGDTLGFVAIVVGLGVMIGRIIELSGGAQRVAMTLINRFGEERAPLALGLTGFIVAIPVFFDVADHPDPAGLRDLAAPLAVTDVLRDPPCGGSGGDARVHPAHAGSRRGGRHRGRRPELGDHLRSGVRHPGIPRGWCPVRQVHR
jgi:hypothetical protein